MSSPITVIEYAYTAYPVADIVRARAFYEGKLGLVVSTVWEEGSNHWIEYDVGGHTLALVAGAAEWRPSKDGPVLALEVADYDAAVAALREAGATFVLETLTTPVCRMCVVLDPEGNSLAIHKRNPAPAAA